MYDYAGDCGCTLIDVLEPIQAPARHCAAHGTLLRRAWLTKFPSVIGDECDIWIRHGLCDPETGQPVHYASKQEIKRETKRRGLINRVEHVGSPGSDKNRHNHTTKWV